MADERPIFSRQQVQDTLRTRDAIKEIQTSMKAMGVDMSKVSQDFAAINKDANAFALAQEKAKKNTSTVNDLLTKGNELIGRANKLTAEVNKKEVERQTNARKIKEIYEELAKNSGKYNVAQQRALRDQAKGLEVVNKELVNESQALLAAADHTKTLGGNFKTLASTSVELSRNIYGVAAGLSEQLGISKNVTSAFERANELQRERKMIILEEEDLISNLKLAYEDYVEEAKAAAVSFDDFKEGIDEAGLSAERLRRFNLEGITEGTEGKGAAKRISDRQKGLSNTRTGLPSALGTMLKPLAKFGTVVTILSKAIEFLKYVFFGIDEEITGMAKEFSMSKEAAGIMREDIKMMAHEIRASSDGMNTLGINTEELVKLQMEFTKHTGMNLRLNQDQFKTLSLMTNQLGFSNDEAIQLTESFKASGMSSEQGLESLMKSYNTMKLQGKATMTFKTLMGDITKDTELQRIFLTQGADAAMRNAQAQRRTGLSLAQQRSMAEGTLDFEKTMTDQLELQMLTGKDINLGKAQELALQGRNGEAVAAMQKEMGKLTAEQKKNPIIMNKMLSLLGMSREEYYEMLNTQAQQAKAQKEEERMVKILQKETGIFHTAKKKMFASEDSFRKGLNVLQKEEFDAAMKKFHSEEQYEQTLNQLRRDGVKEEDLAQTALNNKINEFSEKQIRNARKRAGLMDGEMESFGDNMNAAEAFNKAIKDLKVQLADLVGSGAIEKFSKFLIGFADTLTKGGVFTDMITGRGEKSEEELEAQASKALKSATLQEILKSKGLTEEQYVNLEKTAGAEMGLGGISSDAKGQGTLGFLYNSTIGEAREQLDTIKKELVALEEKKRQEESARRAEEQAKINSEIVEDFILRPGQAPIKFNKGDLIMGGTQLGMGGGKVERLLEELLAETKAGKVIKMDTATVGRSLQLNASKMNY